MASEAPAGVEAKTPRRASQVWAAARSGRASEEFAIEVDDCPNLARAYADHWRQVRAATQ